MDVGSIGVLTLNLTLGGVKVERNGEKNDMDIETRDLIKEMGDKLAEALKPKTDEVALASKPFKADEEQNKSEKFIVKPDEGCKITKKLEAFKTYTFLDELFLDNNQKSIGGIPFGVQLGVTGLPDVGKSILVQEIALRVCDGDKKVLFVTSEDAWRVGNKRYDLESRMKEKAQIIRNDIVGNVFNIYWKNFIVKNLFVMDTINHTELNDWFAFAQAYKYICKKEKIDLVIIDSVSLLENYRGALKYRLLELCKFNQANGITAIYVNQRSTDEWDSYKMAGGIGIAHGLDALLIVDYGKAWNSLVKRDLNVKQGIFVKIVRLTGCRLCGFDGKYHKAEVISDGFLRIVKEE